MKAIHNYAHELRHYKVVGNYKLKYNFESNSQPEPIELGVLGCWEL
nr:hypothetical protein [uncultured Flavobacterium sp.]